MRYLAILLVLCGLCRVGAAADDTNKIRAEFNPTQLPNGRTLIDIHFTNAAPEDVVLAKSIYSVTLKNDGSSVAFIGLGPLGGEDEVAGKLTCRSVYLTGNFDTTQDHVVTIQFPGDTPIKLDVAGVPVPMGSGTNQAAAWARYVADHVSLSILPFDANGNGGLGLQYNLDYNISHYELSGNSIGYLMFELTSKGEFGLNYNSSNTNNITDSMTADAQLKYLFNYTIDNPVDSAASKSLVYPLGILVSPVGFEWNKEFTMGNYRPKVAAGGAIPYLDIPALWWSTLLKLTNAFTPPTLFSGVSYVDPVGDKVTDPVASKVNVRWDTEFIYEFPLLNKVSFLFTYNLYAGLDHEMWKRYYQVGAVYYISKTEKGANGLFFGYANGEQPPAYTRVGSWRLGYSMQF